MHKLDAITEAPPPGFDRVQGRVYAGDLIDEREQALSEGTLVTPELEQPTWPQIGLEGFNLEAMHDVDVEVIGVLVALAVVEFGIEIAHGHLSVLRRGEMAISSRSPEPLHSTSSKPARTYSARAGALLTSTSRATRSMP